MRISINLSSDTYYIVSSSLIFKSHNDGNVNGNFFVKSIPFVYGTLSNFNSFNLDG